jgi:hypothetical protein
MPEIGSGFPETRQVIDEGMFLASGSVLQRKALIGTASANSHGCVLL